MSDPEEENFCFFGKPLEPYDEDAFPKKKPISMEDQIATDAQGRRRFHGAFTGGFSAGFYNTVGSLEGWTPSEFKSTRQEKAQGVTQRPEDFMDEEDVGEFGIAPQTVKATKEFSTVNKRKRQVYADGPIPGEPVLETLLTSGNETVGYLLLKNMGIEDKIAKQREELDESEPKIYGCQMPTRYKIPESIESKQYQIPEIYKQFLANPKTNTFGLGYQGLDKSHVNLFHSTGLVMKDKDNKKISIRGQAFGVGAFEDEDEDIYVREDMSNYDFELTKEKASKKDESDTSNLLFGMFKKSVAPLVFKKLYPPPTIPHSFTGVHKVRKSRFEPIEEERAPVERKDMNPLIRAKYLGEATSETFTESKPVIESKKSTKTSRDIKEDSVPQKTFDISSISISDKFVSASQTEDVHNILEPVQRSETEHGTEQMRDAARMKMFGPLTRVTTDWHPCAILCKRFNVPEPFVDKPEERNKKRTKNLIFEYQKYSDIVETTLKPGLSLTSSQESLETTVVETKDVNPVDSNPAEQPSVESMQTQPSLDEETSVTDSLPKDITEKIDVAEKQDLFRAVFLSSSESEDEEQPKEEKEDNNRTEELKVNVLSDQLLPKIKPIKEGILSNVNFGELFKSRQRTREDAVIEEQGKSEEQVEAAKTTITTEKTEISYGPKLPSQRIELTSKITVVSSDSEDEWVEKSDKKKKAKHKKKHKKEKHKKHRHDKKKDKGEK